MIDRHTSRNKTPRTMPEAPSRSWSRSKLSPPAAAGAANSAIIGSLSYHARRSRSNRVTVGVMRFCTLSALGLALVATAPLAGCSDGQDGAVSVRWRIVDLQTGVTYDPRQQFGTQPPGGECFCAPQSA